MLKRIWNKSLRSKIVLSLFFGLLFLLLFIVRDDFQPSILFVRKYIFIILLVAFIAMRFIRKLRKPIHANIKLKAFIFMLVILSALYYIGVNTGMYSFMQKYAIYKNLDLTEITNLPTTRNERIQPYNNIRTMAYESIGETEEISNPQLVRIGENNKWTMVVQPAKEYALQRIKDNIEEIFSVPSTTAFPRFAGENRESVIFSIGESLSFSRNTYNAVVQKFNPWHYINLEPSEVFYMKNDANEWVEVVSLTKWKGFFFPYPTFGGVMVIKKGKHSATDYLERLLFGKGQYISPKEIKNYNYLQRQNTLSEKVSRLQAESLMFLGGITDPLPWNMKTSVKIPDLKDDQNQQPFVTDFDFSDVDTNAYTGLYHWFGLEPVGKKRSSLSYSVFIPSDGSTHMMYYNHVKNKDGFAGVSAMPLKVMESKKNFDWNLNKPVEFRPYIKDIAGKRRMFVLSTIAAKRKESESFDGSATPDLALVDMEYRDVIWVDVKRPKQWEATIFKQLSSVWKDSEEDSDFFTKHKEIMIDDFIENKIEMDSLPVLEIEEKSKVIVDSTTVFKDSVKIPQEVSAKDRIKQLEAELDSLKIKRLEDEIKLMKNQNVK